MFQYYFFKRLINNELSPRTLWSCYGYVVKKIGAYLSHRYPNMKSVLDVPLDKFMLGYRTYLNEHYNMVYPKDTHVYEHVYYYYEELFDDRKETEKDRWDIRKLGIEYNRTNSLFYIDFRQTPTTFKEMVKRYIEHRMISIQNLKEGSALHYVYALNRFFRLIEQLHPTWRDLNQLNRDDIISFLTLLREEKIGSVRQGKRRSTDEFVNKTIIMIETFLSDIQRYEWDEAPNISVSHLIYPEDKPRRSRVNHDKIKYIPDVVWQQLLDHIHELPPEYIPIVLLFEATGFRGSDVLSLKLDCLQKRDDGWWISGDQRKVKVFDHRVPVSDEIASVVKAQIEMVKQKSINGANPDQYLFVRFSGKRVNQPITTHNFKATLNRLAKRVPILDKDGSVYHFRNHAFRHRYGVNLINNGMPLLHVQKLMAHASPEMTLVYAKIHDTTLREQWEQARQKSAVRLNTQGEIIEADIEMQAQENGLELEWIRHNLDSIRLDHGMCVKSPKISCDYLNQTLEPPCIKNNCRSFHVDTTFLPYYESQITQMERDIEVYKTSGRTRSIEIIEPKLKRYKELANSLRNDGGIFGLPKAKREYVDEEKTHG